MVVADDDQLHSTCFEALKHPQLWYATDEKESLQLQRSAMELASASPQKAPEVFRSLIQALTQGLRCSDRPNERDPRGEVIQLGDAMWETRAELKARCQDVLRHYTEGAQLNENDDRFMRHVLQHHPRGKQKLEDCQGMAVGVHPVHNGRCFFVLRSGGREDFSYVRCVDNAPTVEIQLQRRICDTICDILHMHPAFGPHLAQNIEESFPSVKGKAVTVERHRNWANSILELCERKPELTEYLLSALVRKMVEMDTAIQRVEGGDEIEGDDRELVPYSPLEMLAEILDAQMLKVFEYMQRHLAGDVGESENRLVHALFRIFETNILLTHQSRCVQFLWLYLASLRPAWSEAFLSLLLHTAYANDQTIPKRLIALGYLASFVARAKFLTKNFTLRTAQYVATLARENLQAAEAHLVSGEVRHPQALLFLYAVQALCYMLCFHAADFAEVDPNQPLARTALNVLMFDGATEVGAEAFAPVLESHCNTIGRINKQVAEQLCSSLKVHCPALAASLRQRLREIQEGMTFSHYEAGLDVFFPFDPYRLRHSNMFVASIYRAWNVDGDSDDEGSMDPTGEAAEGFEMMRPVFTNPVRDQDSDIDEDDKSDVDFTDARDATERGFIPSIQPSPAFKPRGSCDMMDIMSPLGLPMSSSEEDDGFTLPSAAIDTDREPSSMLSSLMNCDAFRGGLG